MMIANEYLPTFGALDTESVCYVCMLDEVGTVWM